MPASRPPLTAWSIAALVSVALGAGVGTPLRAAEGGEAEIPSAQMQVDAWAAEAQALVEAGNFVRAQEVYRKAQTLAPGDRTVAEGLARVDAILAGKAGNSGDSGEIVRDQLARVEAKVCMDRAELLAQSGRYEAAQHQLVVARRLLSPLKDLAEAQESLAAIARLSVEYADQESAARMERARKSRSLALIEAEQATRQEELRERSRLSERISRIESLRRRQLYELALGHCRKLVRDFPGEPEAEQLFKEVLEAAHKQRKLTRIEQDKELKQEVLERIERDLIPTGFDGLPDYPVDWALRHETGRTITDERVALPAWHEDLQNRMGRRVSFSFEDTDFVEALKFIATRAEFPLVIDPSVFATDKRITIPAADMRADSALNWLCREAGTHWEYYNETIYVGGKVDVESVWKIYDVSELVMPIYDQPGKVLSYGATGGGGGAQAGGYNRFEDNELQTNEAVSPEDFVDLLKNVISPETWTTEGNDIRISGNILYVTAPIPVHLLVQQFIRSQAHARNILVHVDARWVQLDDNFLEEIGVNWGAQSALLHYPGTTRFDPGHEHENQTNHFNGDVINNLPQSAVQIVPPTSGTGLQLYAMRLGGTHLAAIFQAVERKLRGRFVAEASLATFNGVRSNCFFGREIGFVGDYAITGGTLDPGVRVVNIGLSLDVRPWVSADRKYVTMEVRHSLTSVTFTRENISQVATGIGGNAGVAERQPYPIELDNVLVSAASTQVMVADKGTILMGGFGSHVEETASAKVPFLGHIPFVGRLFGRRGRYSQRQQLYLLATVNIIIYDEEETKL
jgi:tetratricopeptide (TPR) repeat protein